MISLNLNIPFTKEIIFKSKIAEIVSISLEEDVSINDNELLGDFIISGEYKNLDVNVDAMPFNHVVPFKVELDKDVDINTLKYKIDDFDYEVIDEDILKVDITLHVDADIIPKVREDIFVKPDIEDEVIDQNKNKEQVIDVNLENQDSSDNVKREFIINNNLENDYITYHVHTVKMSESLDSIASIYNMSKEDILKLNDINEIVQGDKILIPLNDAK